MFYHIEKLVEFPVRAALVPCHFQTFEPDLCFLPVFTNMYVWGLEAIKTVKFESPAFPVENLGHRSSSQRDRIVLAPRLFLPLAAQRGEGAGDAAA